MVAVRIYGDGTRLHPESISSHDRGEWGLECQNAIALHRSARRAIGSISSLAALATWFLGEADLPLARRIMAQSVIRRESEAGDILDRHFTIGHMIRVYYRDRNRDPAALHLAIEACQQQIDLAPVAKKAFLKGYPLAALPAHGGFEQLAIIREKEKDYLAAIRVATEAEAQGWAGDWAKRIARCNKREASKC